MGRLSDYNLHQLVRNLPIFLSVNYLILLASFGVSGFVHYILYMVHFPQMSSARLGLHDIGQQLAAVAIPAMINSVFAGVVWMSMSALSRRIVVILSMRQFLIIQGAYIAPMVLIVILETLGVDDFALTTMLSGLVVPSLFLAGWWAVLKSLQRY